MNAARAKVDAQPTTFPARRRGVRPLPVLALVLVLSAVLAPLAWIDPFDTFPGAVAQPAAGDLFIGVASNTNKVMWSNDGISWELAATPPPDASAWNDVAIADGRAIAVGTSTGPPFHAVGTSVDGDAWTSRETPKEPLQDIAFGAGLYAATGTADGNGDCGVQTSTDGTSWTCRSTAANVVLRGIVFADDQFVAVGGNTDQGRVFTSADGLTWTQRTPTAATFWQAVTWGNNLYVAVGWDNHIMTSPDGVSWTSRSPPGFNNNIDDVTFGDGVFVAVSQAGDDRIMRSVDGVTWTNEASIGVLSGVDWGSGLFVAVGTSGLIRTSPDGDTWTTRTAPEGGEGDNWRGIGFGSLGVVEVDPGVVTLAPSFVGIVTAVLEGELTDMGSSATVDLGFRLWQGACNTGTLVFNVTAITGATAARLFDHDTSLTQDLEPETSYCYRAWALGNEGAFVLGGEQSFVTQAAFDPTIQTLAAQGVTETSARLRGAISDFEDPPSHDAGFHWSTDPDFATFLNGTAPFVSPGTLDEYHCDVNQPAGDECSGDGPDPLTEDTTYFYRAWVHWFGDLPGFKIADTAANFTTGADVRIETLTATNVVARSAGLRGCIIDLGGGPIQAAGFHWTTDPAFGTFTNESLVIEDLPAEPSICPSGANIFMFFDNDKVDYLEPETQYFYRAWMVNNTGVFHVANEISFTTPEEPFQFPEVTTLAPGTVTGTGATLRGELVSLGDSDSVTVGFQIDTDPPCEVPTQAEIGNQVLTAPGGFSFQVTGLEPNSAHCYRAWARAPEPNDGRVTGQVLSFTTTGGAGTIDLDWQFHTVAQTPSGFDPTGLGVTTHPLSGRWSVLYSWAGNDTAEAFLTDTTDLFDSQRDRTVFQSSSPLPIGNLDWVINGFTGCLAAQSATDRRFILVFSADDAESIQTTGIDSGSGPFFAVPCRWTLPEGVRLGDPRAPVRPVGDVVYRTGQEETAVGTIKLRLRSEDLVTKEFSLGAEADMAATQHHFGVGEPSRNRLIIGISGLTPDSLIGSGTIAILCDSPFNAPHQDHDCVMPDGTGAQALRVEQLGASPEDLRFFTVAVAISTPRHAIAVWGDNLGPLGTGPADIRWRLTQNFESFEPSVRRIASLDEGVEQLRAVSMGPGSYALAGLDDAGQVWVYVTTDNGQIWARSEVATGAVARDPTEHNSAVDVAFDRVKNKLLVAYANATGFVVASADFEPPIPPVVPEDFRFDKKVDDFEPGDTFFGVELAQVATTAGWSLTGLGLFMTLLFTAGLVGGFYGWSRNAPLSFGLGVPLGMITMVTWGFLGLWTIVVMALFGGGVLVLWFRAGFGGGGGTSG